MNLLVHLLALEEKLFKNFKKNTGCTIVINEDPVTEEGIVEILGTDQEGIDAVSQKSILYFLNLKKEIHIK